MGINTWNTFGVNIDENLIIKLADNMVEKGFKKAGYEYLIIDDAWQAEKRDCNGLLSENKNKFKSGLKSVIDYVHSKGLKFGIYSCAGSMTCAGFPGSYGYEFEDARFFAGLGCDYLKYDYCYMPNISEGNKIYHKMGMALRSCGREIVFAACNWGKDDVFKWIRSSGAHTYRSTIDIFDNYVSFTKIALSQLDNLYCSGNNCFNDMDMLTVGMFGQGNVGRGGCNYTEYKTQFALWCMFGVPLIVGGDIRNMDENCINLLQNKTLIRINQDLENRPPYPIGLGINNDKTKNVLFRFLSQNEYALGLFNFDDEEADILVSFAETGINYNKDYCFNLYDVFSEKNIGSYQDYYKEKIAKHDCKIYICKLIKKQ